jgi:hypothetical protein
MPKLKELTPRLRVGKGIERRNLTIFPLFAEDTVHLPEYLPIGAAIRSGAAKITEISEGGSVPTLALDNAGTIPILIIDGEELIGARQNRIANLTILAPGKKILPIPVSCVERGRWSYRGREFAESADIMFCAARAQKSQDVSRAMTNDGSHASDQGAVWNQIAAMSFKLASDSPTHAMHDVYEGHRQTLADYLRELEVADGQIGAIFAINGIAAGVELFDSTDTLRTYLPKIMRSYSLHAIANPTPRAKPAEEAEAAKLLESILDLDARSFAAVGLGEDLRIESPGITGGALAHNGRLIHLAAFQTAPERKE